MTAPVTHGTHLKGPLDSFSLVAGWIDDNWSEILIASAIGVGVYLVLELLRSLALRVSKKLGERHGAVFFLVLNRAIGRTSHIFMALIAARLVVGYADPPPAMLATVRFLFTIGAVLQAALWLRELILGVIELRADPENGGSEALANASGLLRVLVNCAIFVIALVVILDNLGVNVTGLVAGLGIGGIAIGLAAQGIFSDLFASLSILFDRPFKIGETISFDTTTATVERIGLKSTRLRALTGEARIVSNAQLLNKEIGNFAGVERRRYSFPIGLIYQTPPEQLERVQGILRELCEAEGADFFRAGFINFGQSALDFEFQFDVHGDIERASTVRHRLGLAILKRFNAEGLQFAYPTQTTFTADPHGRMIMPYADGKPAED